MTQLRLGTRRSALAVAQATTVARRLEALHADVNVELVAIESTGDRLPGDLSKLGGKGLFTLELERGLHEGDLDLAVHSLKDLPVTLPPGLEVVAYPEREDPRDSLISDVASTLVDLPHGATVLTGSLRRGAQLLAQRPDLRIEGIRGNVGTRVEKWRRSGHAATILAQAGLSRLADWDTEDDDQTVPAHPLDPLDMVPAPGQGTLAVEVRAGSSAAELCRALDDPASAWAARVERHVVAAFGGDCTLPLGAWARQEEDTWRLTAILVTPDGSRTARADVHGDDPEELAEHCVDSMRRDGANDVLARLGR
ncbi:MAG: hydroxymethylbilane synthase [Acidobacteriota bacterium]